MCEWNVNEQNGEDSSHGILQEANQAGPCFFYLPKLWKQGEQELSTNGARRHLKALQRKASQKAQILVEEYTGIHWYVVGS